MLSERKKNIVKKYIYFFLISCAIFLCVNFFNVFCENSFLVKLFLVTTVTTVTTNIVKYQILLLYSIKGNFFTKGLDRRRDRQRDKQLDF